MIHVPPGQAGVISLMCRENFTVSDSMHRVLHSVLLEGWMMDAPEARTLQESFSTCPHHDSSKEH